MLEYIYGEKHREAHVLNARRFMASEPMAYSEDLLDRSHGADRDGLLAFGDLLFVDNHLPAIVSESHADIDLFVIEGVAQHSVVHEIWSRLNLHRHMDVTNAVGIRLGRGVLAKIRSGDVSSLDVRRHANIEAVLCTPDFRVQQHALTTKGRTLSFFAGTIPDANVDPGVLLMRTDWLSAREMSLDRVIGRQWSTVIVRSSAVSEDSFASSNAGAYTSVMGVDGTDRQAIAQAIETVFRSYGDGALDDQVLLQRQIVDSMISGVCSSRVVGRNSPYLVINYDDTSGRTDTVTSGNTNELKTLFVCRTAKDSEVCATRPLQRLLSAVREIERCAGHHALDIEFIVDRDEAIHIVQIRPLVGDYTDADDDAIEARLRFSEDVFGYRQLKVDGVLQGARTAFGIMPDANPAELIGLKPRPLAFSLYQRLITDTVVTKQRQEYGYRDVRPVQHMVKLGGSPYIDVRSSFNSFTPGTLPSSLAEKLIDLYIDRLERDPSLHDKVEFEVVVSTWFPGLGDWLRTRYGDALNENEIVEICDAGKEIFLSAMHRVQSDTSEVEDFKHKFDEIMSSDCAHLVKAWRFIEVCHHHGCKPFAHLARSAFVAVSTLKGLVRVGALDSAEYESYLHSIESISSEMERDAVSVQSGELEKTAFYQKYGHLRPGTYDILTPAYFEDPARYLDPVIAAARNVDKRGWKLAGSTVQKINMVFADELDGLTFDAFDRFARRAIHGREYGKFVYTRFLSHGLDQLCRWGRTVGLSRDDVAYLHLHDLDQIIAGMSHMDDASLRMLVASRRRDYELDSRIELPDLIFDIADFRSFHKHAGQPNFITNRAITAHSICVLSTSDPATLDLRGKIVIVESADPGFDWLFGHSIAGLITRYGGANSHMAIRCAELAIPAAIGVGDLLFGKIECATDILLDCASKRISPVART